MTRNEAEKKMAAVETPGKGSSRSSACAFLDALEALGLLTFEREPNEDDAVRDSLAAVSIRLTDPADLHIFFNELHARGYSVVKA